MTDMTLDERLEAIKALTEKIMKQIVDIKLALGEPVEEEERLKAQSFINSSEIL